MGGRLWEILRRWRSAAVTDEKVANVFLSERLFSRSGTLFDMLVTAKKHVHHAVIVLHFLNLFTLEEHIAQICTTFARMNGVIRNIAFFTSDKGDWVRTIHKNRQNVPDAGNDDGVCLVFHDIAVEDIEPMHIVTLACLIEFFVRKKYSVRMSTDSSPVVGKFLFETLQFPKYWQGKQNYVPANDADSIFNLWRLVDSEKETYSQKVHDYLQGRFFKDKDLSAVKNSLLEVYYNVSDHAEAKGNAFSFIKFDANTGTLRVAVCDFGKGIANTVREKLPEIGDDATALRRAMDDLFTIGSQTHNKGLGLGNIRRTCIGEHDALRIISNRGFLYSNSDFIGVREGNMILDGTLIYYELSLSHFDDLEIILNFEL